MEKILVTGGAGYIGSHTVYYLIEKGYSVVVVDNLSTGHRWAIHPRAVFYQGDIRDESFLNEVFCKEPEIRAVIHFAACSLVGESMQDPLKYYDNNLYGTKCLLAVMKKFGVDKIVFSSTAAVYGQPERIPILETASACPTNPYGETKLSMEKMFHWCSMAYGLRYVSLRYFNACGAMENGEIGEAHTPETHLIPIVLQAAAGKRDRVLVYGNDYPTEDGTCVRDYIHVTDLADAHKRSVEYLFHGGESNVFNLGNGQGFSVRQVLDCAKKVTGRDFFVEEGPRRPGDPAILIASGEKAKRILGWEPYYTDLDKILETAWRWHQKA